MFLQNCFYTRLVLITIPLLFIACQPTNDPAQEEHSEVVNNDDPLAGAQQMRDSIDAIKASVNFRNHPYESRLKLNILEPEVLLANQQKTLNIQLLFEYIQTLVRAGDTEKAIQGIEQLLRTSPTQQRIDETTRVLHETRAIAYLRLAEQNNCNQNHNEESCLFPVKGRGIHLQPEPAQKAIEIYEQLLTVFPDDLNSRWLLNLAYMTTGGYPSQVPPQWLIPASKFKPEAKLPEFANISLHLGIDVNDLAGGSIVDDFNNDGFLDILASSWDMNGSIRFFLNNGQGSFTEQTADAQLGNTTGGLNLVQADYNNDGYLDFYILRGAWSGFAWMGQLPNSLIKNNGDGTFSDVTIAAGLYDAQPTQSAVWFDFNTDGLLDLFVANETHSPQEIHPCQLFLNEGNGHFRDIAPALGLNFGVYAKGVTAGDVNNDGRPDLYLSLLNAPNKLLINQGGSSPEQWKFQDISKQAGIEQPLGSFPTWFFDYDNDGNEDIFVASYDQYALQQQAADVAADYLGLPFATELSRLYHNNGDGTFTDLTEKTGLKRALATMGCNFGDLDNDGYQDFYLGTGAPDFRSVVPNRMFKNNAGQTFQDVTYAGNFGHVQKGHAISFADVDNDGDQDIHAVMGGAVSGDFFQNSFFENPGNGNDWVTLRLTGTTSNRSAIGARIKMMVAYQDGTTRTIYHTVNSGGSFGANSLQAEIGLGAKVKTASLSIDWPDGKPGYVDYGNIPIKAILQITEDSAEVKVVTQTKIELVRAGGSHEHHGH